MRNAVHLFFSFQSAIFSMLLRAFQALARAQKKFVKFFAVLGQFPFVPFYSLVVITNRRQLLF